MKKMCFFKILVLSAIVSLLLACGSSSDSDSSLSVKFTNESASDSTITVIQLRSMGRADASEPTVGEWGMNLLSSEESLAPSEHTFFSLDIPNGHWSECRLGVANGPETIMLDEQTDYEDAQSGFVVCSITHWGSDEREVSVVVENPANDGYDVIVLTGITDFAY